MDLFSGPGGLAEGFAALRSPKGRRRFDVVLSIEKDEDAHRTLRLRTFLRKFGTNLPHEYYDFLNGIVSEEPAWAQLYPKQWAAAFAETKCLELGTPAANAFVLPRIKEIRQRHGGRTVLLGGPPCQSYSVIGRSRNVGNKEYDPDDDRRQLLYKEYVQVLDRLCPIVAVLENVRGILSARRCGNPIFEEVMQSLRGAGRLGYRLFALTPQSSACSSSEELTDQDFIVRAENHGIPQSRHRVVVICVRRDIADALPKECLPRLEPQHDTVSMKDVIGTMPRLRSRLSRNDDPDAWQAALRNASDLVDSNRPPIMSPIEEKRFRRIVAEVRRAANGSAPPSYGASGKVKLPAHCPPELRDWLFDGRVTRLANNETKGHMPADLERYLFASIFARTFRRSPSSSAFPKPLAPAHANWHTGKFADRYRVQLADRPCTTITSHIAKDGHYYIHPDPRQCRSLTVREAARLQTFPDNFLFHGTRTQQYTQVGNAVPPLLAYQIARALWKIVEYHDQVEVRSDRRKSKSSSRISVDQGQLPLFAAKAA